MMASMPVGNAPPPPPPLLQCVRSLMHSVAPLDALPHVAALVSEFLDWRLRWDVPRACALGDMELLRYIDRRQEQHPSEWAKREPLYRTWQFTKGTVVAARAGNIDVLRWLLTEFDEEASVTTAVDAAAKSGHLHVLHWLDDNFSERVDWSFGGICHALANNHLEIAQWIAESKTVLTDGRVLSITKFGNLEMLQWLKTIGALPEASAVANAAQHGHLEAAKLIERLWSIPATELDVAFTAVHENLELVDRWLVNGSKCVFDDIAADAAANGDLHELKRLHESGIQTAYTLGRHQSSLWTPAVMDNAATNGHLDIVKWLHVHRHERCTSAAMDGAATNGHLEVVKWLHFARLRIDGVPDDTSEGVWRLKPRRGACTVAAMDGAAKNNHMEIVEWLYKHRIEGCTTAAMDMAAGNGHLDMVRWLHEHRMGGCTTVAMDKAASNGHLEIVRWLHQNRSEGCTTVAMDKAASNGHLEIVRWLHQNRSEGCTAAAMDGAAKRCHVRVMQWLHVHRQLICPPPATSAIERAAAGGYVDIIEWLTEECGYMCTKRAMENAVRNGHLNAVLYLHYKGHVPTSHDMASLAAAGGHLEVLQWLTGRHGIHTIRKAAYDSASLHNQLFCARWLNGPRDLFGESQRGGWEALFGIGWDVRFT